MIVLDALKLVFVGGPFHIEFRNVASGVLSIATSAQPVALCLCAEHLRQL